MYSKLFQSVPEQFHLLLKHVVLKKKCFDFDGRNESFIDVMK